MPRLALAAVCLFASTTVGISAELTGDVAAALSEDESVAGKAIERLRARGREGFDELAGLDTEALGIDRTRWEAAVDAVGGARYCSVSKLYWHTDLDDALAEAERTGKPVLALRMMGKLTDEFSCANSRFFRTTLYANTAISEMLREGYVLHWGSVRPVPKVTVDFGDGRKLERTLTGNSIHYVLTADGHVVDGLPGLYSPSRFTDWLRRMQDIAVTYNRMDNEKRTELRKMLVTYLHERQVSRILRAWKADLDAIGAEDAAAAAADGTTPVAAPPAREAAVLARPKALVELPLIADVTMETRRLSERTDEGMWSRIAARHAGESFDDTTLALIARENPALLANLIAPTKRKVENPLIRLITKLQSSVAMDSVRNEYDLHRRLHQWFVDGEAPSNLDELNEKVYAELFLTPSSDPWIGLVQPDVYTGLDNAGVVDSGAE